jgi:hypothetical protein
MAANPKRLCIQIKVCKAFSDVFFFSLFSFLIYRIEPVKQIQSFPPGGR